MNKTLATFFGRYVPAPLAAILAAGAAFAAQYLGLDAGTIKGFLSNLEGKDAIVPALLAAFTYLTRQAPAPEPKDPAPQVDLKSRAARVVDVSPTPQAKAKELNVGWQMEVGERLSSLELKVGHLQHDAKRRDLLDLSKEIEANKLPRNIRNNNPLNIKHSRSNWQGIDPGGNDKTFVTFTSPLYGIRAAALLLRNYQIKYQLDTVKSIIERWAPSQGDDADNTTAQTSNYVAHVAGALGVSPTASIRLTDNVLHAMIVAMGRYEGGEALPYTQSQYTSAFALLPDSMRNYA